MQRKHYSVSLMIFLLAIGGIFVALGIGIGIALIRSAVKGGGKAGAAVLLPLFLFCLLPIAFGCIPLVLAIKQIYYAVGEKKALRVGTDATARIIDYKCVAHHGRANKRYALVLAYVQNGEQKRFTTDYVFDINEFRRLQSLKCVKIKVDGNFVAVAETFTEDDYKLHPKYEIEMEFFRQPVVKNALRVWAVLSILALIAVVVSIVLTVTKNESLFLIIAVLSFGAVQIPFVIITAVCLIKWLVRKK